MTEVGRGRPLGVLIVGVGLLAAVAALLFAPDLGLAGAQVGCGPTGASGASGASGTSGATGATCGPTGYPLYVPGAQPSGGTEQALPALDDQRSATGSGAPVAIAAIAATAVLAQVAVVVSQRRRRSSTGTGRS